MRFLLAVVLLSPALASGNELSRVYALALQNDAQLQAAAHARDAVLEGDARARGALLPQVNGFGSLSRENNEITATGPVPPGTPVTRSASGEPYNLTVSLRQALFDAAAWNRWQQAGRQAVAAQARYRIAEQALTLRVTEAYFNLLAAADSVRFADAEKKAVERQLELAKRRFEVGLSAITDVQEAQARYDLTVAQLIEAEQALSSARVAVAEITGAVDLRIAQLREEIPLLGPDPDSVDDWLKTAAESSLDLRLARAQADAAAQDVDVSRSGHYPTLSFVGQRSVGEEAGFNQFEYDTDRVGLELNVPIFAGGATQAAVNQSRSTHQQRLAELESARRQVERNTRIAYQGVIAGVARVRALKQAVVSSTTALEASEVGLEVGARTAVDVLNAQRELYRAQRDYARSRYDYLLNILRLKSAAGRLEVRDLNEIDALLGAAVATEVAG
jgi:outer membrane protein